MKKEIEQSTQTVELPERVRQILAETNQIIQSQNARRSEAIEMFCAGRGIDITKVRGITDLNLILENDESRPITEGTQ